MKDLSASVAASLVILAFTAVGGIVSARLLLPAGKGELTAVLLWPALLVSIGSLGMPEAIAYFSAGRPTRSRDIVASGLLVECATSAVLMVAGYALLPVLLDHYGPQTVKTARLLLVYIPISLATTALMGAIQGNLLLVHYNVLRAFVQIATVLGMIVLALSNRLSVLTFALAALAANVATLALAFWIAYRRGWVGGRPHAKAVSELLRYGLRSHVGSIASILNVRLDQMLMSAFLVASTLGVYVVAVTTASLVTLGPVALGLVAFPRISSAGAADAQVALWGRYVRAGAVLAFVAAAVMWYLAPTVIELCFGRAYASAAPVARVLIVAAVPLGVNMVLSAGFRAINRPLVASVAEIVSLGGTAVFLWMLLRPYGAMGAAWASLLAYSVSTMFMLSRTRGSAGALPASLFRPSQEDWKFAARLVKFSRGSAAE